MSTTTTVKLYLAPANHYNAYCIAGYNEKTQCEQLARLVQERLSAYDGTAVYHTTVYADSRDYKGRPEEAAALSAGALFMQGVATSIDALSVGFTISEYGWLMALAASIIIAVVTFFLCMAGLNIGKKFGTELSGKASILGGVILIGIGLEIFISGVL